MKDLLCLGLILLLTLGLSSAVLAEGSDLTSGDVVDENALTYTLTYDPETTALSNGFQSGYIQYFYNTQDEYHLDFEQVNTLTLHADGTYTLRKSLQTGDGTEENTFGVAFTFNGNYERNGEQVTLAAAEKGELAHNWGPLSVMFPDFVGTTTSAEDPSILSSFPRAFLGVATGNEAVTITLNDEAMTYAMERDGVKNVEIAKAANDERYSVAQTEALASSPLEGKTIIFLGSSITFGSASMEESFADYLAKRDGITAVKEAVSGTTLVNNGADSYVERMKTIDSAMTADAFVCQLSTNDASQGQPFGEISDSMDMVDFDTATTAGAIEYIIAYAKETWNCPVIFFTNPHFASNEYAELVSLLLEIQAKWDIGVIDMWNDTVFNDITDDERTLYMADNIHPTRAGYREWWTPKFESFLYEYLK